ncbi:hypothetical protein ACP70R_004908 [Stipagrostis hirtigluma subsp. patula]
MPGGGAGDVARPRTQARGRRRRQATSLPLDVVLAIAARSDAATVIRCAATCADVRRRVVDDPTFGGRLRLRHIDRFVLPLLRGHLIERRTGSRDDNGLYLVDTAAAGATRLCRVPRAVPSGAAGEPMSLDSVTSRDGLLLLSLTDESTSPVLRVLCVRDPATGRSLTLPTEPGFPRAAGSRADSYVLLVGDGEDGGAASAVGRPFQVLKANLYSSHVRQHCFVQLQTFSSEHGEWGRYAEIPTPQLHGCYLSDEPLVVGGAVHWLCGNCVIKLRIRTARANMTTLPASFPGETWCSRLLAMSADGNLMVLVADGKKISAWEQSKHTLIWKKQPWVVIEVDEILRFNNVVGLIEKPRYSSLGVRLIWFAERSGAVLIYIDYYGLFWLDLQSKKIVRWLDPQKTRRLDTVYCPIERDLSSWVPTFSCTI